MGGCGGDKFIPVPGLVPKLRGALRDFFSSYSVPGFWHLSILYRLLYSSYLLLACLNRGCANLVPTFVFSFTCFCIFCICYFVSSQNLVPVQTVVRRLASRAPNVACSPLPCLEINDHDATQCILINCHDNPTIMPRCVKYHRHLGKGTCMVANS